MADGQAVCPQCGMGPLSPDGRWMWDGTQWVPAAAPPPPQPPQPPPPPGPAYPGSPLPYGGSPYGGSPYGGSPYGGSPYGGPPSSGTNGLAIASLVLGILWLSGIGSLLAVIFGHVSKRQIQERNEGGNGLATAGLILGYIGLAGAFFFILVVAGAISVFNSQLSSTHAAFVRSDLRNAATAEESYLVDHGVYTNQVSDLYNEGFIAISQAHLALGFDSTRGYCIAGSYDGQGSWYLYDSEAGGLSLTTYGSVSEAESACSDPAMSFAGL
ncbi:MAG TPA: DUF4190 domain-containing protein [Mycobacteriales bacterium]|nr:DUF4190 domain-containing protein [Mycobacteriales bacterium]